MIAYKAYSRHDLDDYVPDRPRRRLDVSPAPGDVTPAASPTAAAALSAAAAAGCSFDKDPYARKRFHVPDPTDVAISRWATDPFARGHGSVVLPGGSITARAALGTPVADRIYLASEATSTDRPSTPDGAWAAGLLAARRVLEAHGANATVVVVCAGLAGCAATGAGRTRPASPSRPSRPRTGSAARPARSDSPSRPSTSAVAGRSHAGAPLQPVIDDLHLPHATLASGQAIHDTDGSLPGGRAREVQRHRDELLGRAIRVTVASGDVASLATAMEGSDPHWDRDKALAWAIDDSITQRRGAPPTAIAQAAWLEGTPTTPVVLRRARGGGDGVRPGRRRAHRPAGPPDRVGCQGGPRRHVAGIDTRRRGDPTGYTAPIRVLPGRGHRVRPAAARGRRSGRSPAAGARAEPPRRPPVPHRSGIPPAASAASAPRPAASRRGPTSRRRWVPRSWSPPSPARRPAASKSQTNAQLTAEALAALRAMYS